LAENDWPDASSRVVVGNFLDQLNDGLPQTIMINSRECLQQPIGMRLGELIKDRLLVGIRHFIAALEQNIEAIDDAYTSVRGYLEAHRDELGVAELDVAAFICVTAVEALTHAAVLHRPEILTGEKAGRFVDEVTRLMVRYLQRP